MLKIAVIDNSAEARCAIVDQLAASLRSPGVGAELLPPIDLVSIAPQEIKYRGTPDLVFLGPNLIKSDLATVNTIRRTYASVSLIALLSQDKDHLLRVEQLARIGIDDILSPAAPALELLRLLLFQLQRTKANQKKGRLILVDSGKGGSGVTSVAAALGESLLDQRQRTLLVDLDFATQDLSRFLQVRPFVNENLQLILSQERPLTAEFAAQCHTQVWEDEENLQLAAPIADPQLLALAHGKELHIFLNVLEYLRSSFDSIVVDIGSASESLLQSLYRNCDISVFLVNGDPATLFAAVHRLGRLRRIVAPNTRILLLENKPQAQLLPSSFLKGELAVIWPDSELHWCPCALPFSKVGFRWPGSGSTLYTQSNKVMSSALRRLARTCCGKDQPDAAAGASDSWISCWQRLCARLPRRALPHTNETRLGLPLPKVMEPEVKIAAPAPACAAVKGAPVTASTPQTGREENQLISPAEVLN